MKVLKILTVFATTSVVTYSSFTPVAYALWPVATLVGNLAGSAAKRLGANKTITNYIKNGVGAAMGDPIAQAKLIVSGMKDTGIIGDAASCQAMSNLASTGTSLVAAYYTGGTAAGIAGKLSGTVMGGACKESFGSPINPSDVQTAEQQYRQIYEAQRQQIQSQEKITLAQIKAGERIVELQTQAKLQEAKIIAESALEVENTKQKGEAERAIIQAQNLLEMTKMNNEKELELAYIDLQKVQVTEEGQTARTEIDAQARTRIEELKQAGRVTEAQLIADTLQRKVEAEQSGQTERAKSEADALVAMTRDTNATNLEIAKDTNIRNENITRDTNATNLEIAKADANAQKNQALIQTIGTTVGTVIDSTARTNQQKRAADVEKARIAADLEKARIAADVERQRIAAEAERQKLAAANTGVSAADRLLAEWGWTKVACYPGLAFITGLGNDTICVNPSAAIAAGQYRYERASNQLIPLAAVSNPVLTPVEPTINVVPVQNNVEPQGDVF